MGKVKELSTKYPNISATTFKKFLESDKTQTKKYLEYMLKMWYDRNVNGSPNTTMPLIEAVQKFDNLLPYIKNKDIYSTEYSSYSALEKVLSQAEDAKEDATFVKEQHVDVLDETDEYIFLVPKTHRGSLKYGSGTKWCTASRNNREYFYRYSRNGVLCYVISKIDGDKFGVELAVGVFVCVTV